MESQPQKPEFRINPENFHPCIGLYCLQYMLPKIYGDRGADDNCLGGESG